MGADKKSDLKEITEGLYNAEKHSALKTTDPYNRILWMTRMQLALKRKTQITKRITITTTTTIK